MRAALSTSSLLEQPSQLQHVARLVERNPFQLRAVCQQLPVDPNRARNVAASAGGARNAIAKEQVVRQYGAWNAQRYTALRQLAGRKDRRCASCVTAHQRQLALENRMPQALDRVRRAVRASLCVGKRCRPVETALAACRRNVEIVFVAARRENPVEG